MKRNRLRANWNYPTSIMVGEGRLQELTEICFGLKIKRPLLVTDSGLVTSTVVANSMSLCLNGKIDCKIFSNIKSNPTDKNVYDGIKVFIRDNHDSVIAVGGGSVIDTAKAIAVLARQSLSLWDLEDRSDNWKNANCSSIAPIIAIPTTAGTGSEVGRAAVIVDTKKNRKRIIFHPLMMPKIVILDPLVTVSLPPELTASTGMDCLSHNIEAWCSPNYHPMAEGISIEGIKRVRDNLERVVFNGNDLEARTNMLVASTMGATAFQRGLGAMHALAHPIGGLYDSHHGTLNAVLMPYVLIANRPAIESRIDALSGYIGIQNPCFSRFLDWILELRDKLKIPPDLNTLGIDDHHLSEVGKLATEDPSSITNPIQFSPKQYREIFRRALYGRLGDVL